MLKKLFNHRKSTVYLIVLVGIFSLAILYSQEGYIKTAAWWGGNASMALLVCHILLCNYGRLKGLLKNKPRSQGIGLTFRKSIEVPLNSEAAIRKLRVIFQGLGYRLTEAPAEIPSHKQLAAHKYLSGTWGSIFFHLGLVVMMVGLLANALWGFRAAAVVPEGVTITIPEELSVYKRGPLFENPYSATVLLNRFSYGSGTNSLLRPEAELVFKDGRGKKQETVRVDYPAYYKGVYYRYQDSGYSLLLNITTPDGPLVYDYANLGSHTATVWYDTVPVSQDQLLEIKFFPDYFQEKDKYASRTGFPKNPVMELTFINQQERIGPVLIPMGEKVSLKGYDFSFEEYRYWQALDVWSDPGRYLIYLGGLMAVAGLLWRIIFITRKIFIRVEELNNYRSRIWWHLSVTYGLDDAQEEIGKVLEGLGGANDDFS